MDQTVVLEIRGRVTIGHDAQLRDAIRQALDGGTRNVLLRMRYVTRLDSSGIGELVAAHTTVRRGGGRLLVAELPPKVAKVLQITNLLGVIELYDHMDGALAALGGDDRGAPLRS